MLPGMDELPLAAIMTACAEHDDVLARCDAVCAELERAELDFDPEEMASALEIFFLSEPDADRDAIAAVIQRRLW